MKATLIFPCLLIVLDLGAAAVYGYHLDFKHMLYWLAAAVLTACVTF